MPPLAAPALAALPCWMNTARFLVQARDQAERLLRAYPRSNDMRTRRLGYLLRGLSAVGSVGRAFVGGIGVAARILGHAVSPSHLTSAKASQSSQISLVGLSPRPCDPYGTLAAVAALLAAAYRMARS